MSSSAQIEQIMSENDVHGTESEISDVRNDTRNILFKPDTDRALEELQILQKLLLHDSFDSYEDYSVTTAQTTDLLGMEDSLFSSHFDHLAGQNNDKSRVQGPLWSVEEPELTMIQREETNEFNRIHELEERLRRARSSRLKSFQDLIIVDRVPTTIHEDSRSNSFLIPNRTDFELYSTSQKSSISQMPSRDAMKKLDDLGRFIAGSTDRKIMTAWNYLEYQFTDQTNRLIAQKDDNDVYPPPNSAGDRSIANGILTAEIADLTGFLCSVDVKVSHTEIWDLYKKMRLSEEDTAISLRVAALRACLKSSPDSQLVCEEELSLLLKDMNSTRVKRFISIDDLKAAVFPKDPKEALKDMQALAGQRANCLAVFLEEKKKSEELKRALESRKFKASYDFEAIFKDVQLVKGRYNRLKHGALVQVLNYCKTSYEKSLIKKEVEISHELIELLGLNAFPEMIRNTFADLAIRTESTKSSGSVMGSVMGSKANSRMSSERTSFNSGIKSTRRSMNFERRSFIRSGIDVTDIEKSVSTAVSNSLTVASSSIDRGDKEVDKKVINFPDGFRIHLQGTDGGLTVVKLLRATVAFGKGLVGVAVKDVVTYLQAYCSTRIQAFFRGFRRGWRYRVAKMKWMTKNIVVLRYFYNIWNNKTSRMLQTRYSCWRKVIVWKNYVRLNKARRELFRICHWPFYVWRRYSVALATAKEKTKFLVVRMVPTLRTMTVFRAWKVYALREHRLCRRADAFLKGKMDVQVMRAYKWLLYWSWQRRGIRHRWTYKGLTMRRRILFIRQNCPFQIWKAYAMYRKQVRTRMLAGHSAFRLLFAPNVTPRPLNTATMKKKKAKEESEKAKDEEIKNKMRELKKRAEAAKEVVPTPKKGKPTVTKGRNMDDSTMGSISDSDSITEGEDHLRGSHDRDALIVATLDEDPLASQRGHVLNSQRGLPSHRSVGSRTSRGPELRNEEVMGTGRKEKERSPSMMKKGSVALSSRKPSAAVTGGTGTSLLAVAMNNQKSIFAKPFHWIKGIEKGQDVDSDEEEPDEVPVPDRLQYAYDNTLGLQPLPSEDNIPICFIQFADKYTIGRINQMAVNWKLWETFGMLEMVGRFIRFAARAFSNWRFFAIFKRKARVAKKKYWQKQERVVVAEWLEWIRVKDEAVASNTTSKGAYGQAEVIAHIIRGNRRARIARRSKAYQEIKQLNADPNPDDASISSEAKFAKRKSNFEMLKRGTPSQTFKIDRVSDTPQGISGEDLFQWDDEDRFQTEDMALRMVNLSSQMKVQAFRASRVSDFAAEKNLADRLRHSDMLKQVMSFEGALTTIAIQQEHIYVSEFKKNAAEVLLNTLTRVYQDLLFSTIRAETRIYFRTIRMAMVMKRSRSMLVRKKLVNWIRICQRLNGLANNAPYYRAKRVQWGIFNRWLKLLERESLDCTAGLVDDLIVRRRQHDRYSLYLSDLGFKRVVCINSSRLAAASVTTEALFLRWLMFVQEKKIMYKMEIFAAKQNRLKILLRCFLAIKTSLPASEIYQFIAYHNRDFFPVVRVQCDIEQMSKRFIAINRRSLAFIIGKYNRKFINLMQKDARKYTSFRLFLSSLKFQIAKRLTVEQRIISESFDSRGVQKFVDVPAPDPISREKYLPAVMLSAEGTCVCDPFVTETISDELDEETPSHQTAQKTYTVPSIAICGGYKLFKIRFSFQDTVGLVGWQLIWSGDGTEGVESPKRGQWNGGALIMHEVIIPKEDFMVGLEFMYEGGDIMSLRVKLYFGGFTPWVGLKAGMVSFTSLLEANMAAEQDFEREGPNKVVVLPVEVQRPAMLRNYVIGLSGVYTGSKLTALGLVVRKVKEQNVFSYYWVQDALDAVEAEKASKLLKIYEENQRKNNNLPSLSRPDTPMESTSQKESRKDKDGGDLSVSFPPIVKQPSTSNILHSAPHSARHTHLPRSRGGSLSDNASESRDIEFSDGTGSPGNQSDSESESPMAKRMNEYKRRKEAQKVEEEAMALINKRKNQTEKKLVLTSSDREFFDVLRMRSTEVRAAEQRALAFAQRLWSDPKIGNNPDVSKLITMRIISCLTRWFFDVLSRHLIGFETADLRGGEYLEQAIFLRSKAASFGRKKKGIQMQITALQKQPQAWDGLGLLSPYLRGLKNVYKDKQKVLLEKLNALKGEELVIRNEALEVEKAGRRLMPQIPLTVGICTNYRLKIAATRSKAELLQRMNAGLSRASTMANGGGEEDNLISRENMTLLLKSMAQKAVEKSDVFASAYGPVDENELAASLILNSFEDQINSEMTLEGMRQTAFDESTKVNLMAKEKGERRLARMRGTDNFVYSTATSNGLGTQNRKNLKKSQSNRDKMAMSKTMNSIHGMTGINGLGSGIGSGSFGLGQSQYSHSSALIVDNDLFNSTLTSPSYLVGFPSMKAFPSARKS